MAELLPPMTREAVPGRLPGGLFNNSPEYQANCDAWDEAPKAEAIYRPAIAEICRRHGLPEGGVRKYPGGTVIVFALADSHVIKLYSPYFPDDLSIEAAALEALAALPGMPTPRVVAQGTLEGWPYLVMSQLQGRELGEIRAELGREEHLRIVRELGALTASMHALPLEGALAPLRIDWPCYVTDQAASCVARQERAGLSSSWLVQIPEYFERWLAQAQSSRIGLLHTELMEGVFLFEQGQDAFELSGLFDFGDALIGPVEYELASVGIFLTRGDAGLMWAFLEGYGWEADPELVQRCMLHTLLHRYCHLPWFMKMTPPPETVRTFDELAQFWFGSASPS